MRTVVGVLRGGPSSEYEASLQTGAHILAELNPEKYDARDIFISRDGQWHARGVAVDPGHALNGIDVAFNAMHGEYGEDGQVQRILEAHGTPYTGSDAFASTVAYNKQHTKELVSKLGIKVVRGVLVEPSRDIDTVALNLFRTFPHPSVVKPIAGSASKGVTIAHSYDDLRDALSQAFAVAPVALVEEYIKGREATVGVIDSYRNEKVYSLLPTEITLPPQPMFSRQVRGVTGVVERVPGIFTDAEKAELAASAKKIHEGLALSHYSQSDFIVGKRGIYFLEVNTHPSVAQESLLHRSLHAVGSKVSDFADHVVSLALKRKKR